jgi:hypothetical protein
MTVFEVPLILCFVYGRRPYSCSVFKEASLHLTQPILARHHEDITFACQ